MLPSPVSELYLSANDIISMYFVYIFQVNVESYAANFNYYENYIFLREFYIYFINHYI